MANQKPFYHVFLSFRGTDTRNSFTCVLHKELERVKLKSFMDDKDITKGEKFPPRIEEGIRHSMSAIIIFSKDFGSSTWCLRELALILERKKSNHDYILLPIYYEVKPWEVRFQSGDFQAGFEEQKKWHGEEELEKWREALREVSTYNAEIVDGKITEFVHRVVKEHKTKLDCLIAQKPCSILSAKCPPGGEDKVVLYTKFGDTPTSQEAQDSLKVKKVLEDHNVDFEERNIKKYPRFKNEVTLACPRLFVMGNYVGGPEVQSWKKNHLESVFLNFKMKEENFYKPCGVDTVVIYMSDKKGPNSQAVKDSQEVIKILREQNVYFEIRNAYGSGPVKNELSILLKKFKYGILDNCGYKYPIIFAKGNYVGGLKQVENLQQKGELKSTLLNIKK